MLLVVYPINKLASNSANKDGSIPITDDVFDTAFEFEYYLTGDLKSETPSSTLLKKQKLFKEN